MQALPNCYPTSVFIVKRRKVKKLTGRKGHLQEHCFKCHLASTAFAKGQSVMFLNTRGQRERTRLNWLEQGTHLIQVDSLTFKCHQWLHGAMCQFTRNNMCRVVPQRIAAVNQLGDLYLKLLFPCWLSDDWVWLDSFPSSVFSSSVTLELLMLCEVLLVRGSSFLQLLVLMEVFEQVSVLEQNTNNK